jgi:hypothetical protein
MLTHKEKMSLSSSRFIAEHLQYFCQKWCKREDCPQHFEDIMRRFLKLDKVEQRKYYIIDDMLFTIDQVSESYQYLDPGTAKYSRFTKGWIKTS